MKEMLNSYKTQKNKRRWNIDCAIKTAILSPKFAKQLEDILKDLEATSRDVEKVLLHKDNKTLFKRVIGSEITIAQVVLSYLSTEFLMNNLSRDDGKYFNQLCDTLHNKLILNKENLEEIEKALRLLEERKINISPARRKKIFS